jgi:hypothetical protein
MRRTTDRATARARGIPANCVPGPQPHSGMRRLSRGHLRFLCHGKRGIAGPDTAYAQLARARAGRPRHVWSCRLLGGGSAAEAQGERPPNRLTAATWPRCRCQRHELRRGGSSVALGGGHFAPPRLFRHRTRQLRKRRGRDSNPRYACAYNGFRGCFVQPMNPVVERSGNGRGMSGGMNLKSDQVPASPVIALRREEETARYQMARRQLVPAAAGAHPAGISRSRDAVGKRFGGVDFANRDDALAPAIALRRHAEG